MLPTNLIKDDDTFETWIPSLPQVGESELSFKIASPRKYKVPSPDAEPLKLFDMLRFVSEEARLAKFMNPVLAITTACYFLGREIPFNISEPNGNAWLSFDGSSIEGTEEVRDLVSAQYATISSILSNIHEYPFKLEPLNPQVSLAKMVKDVDS